MPQHQLLDVFGELAAPTPGQQPQHSRTGEIGEGKENVPLLSPPGRQRRQGRAPSAGAPATPSKRQHDLVLARAREIDNSADNPAAPPELPGYGRAPTSGTGILGPLTL